MTTEKDNLSTTIRKLQTYVNKSLDDTGSNI